MKIQWITSKREIAAIVVVGLIAGTVVTLLSGCVTIPQGTVDAVAAAITATPAKPAPALITVPGTPPPIPQAQTLWPAVECDWMIHGEGTGENEIRAAAIRQAAAEGKAIRFKFRETGTDLRFWLLWWESDVDRGKFPNPEMATPKALAAGVKRWVVDVTDCSDALVCDTFTAYGDEAHQLQIIGASPGVIKGLGLDSNGVKITAPKYRQ